MLLIELRFYNSITATGRARKEVYMIHDMKTEAKQEIAWRNSLKHLVNKRVEVEYSQSVDWAGFSGTKRGWLQEYEGRLILVARRGSNRFINLTGGMFDGFHSTITVKNIRQV